MKLLEILWNAIFGLVVIIILGLIYLSPFIIAAFVVLKLAEMFA